MEIETITPKRARDYLATRTANRNVSDGRVLEYAIAMEQGSWTLNGETIKFDADGHLFDGQHRLLACDLAGVSFDTYVVRGVKDARAMATVDTGKARSHTDVWVIAGHGSAALTSSIAMLVLLHEQKRVNWSGFVHRRLPRSSEVAKKAKNIAHASSYVSKEELLGFGEAHIDQLARAAHFVGASPVRKVISPQAAGGLYYFAESKDPVAIGQFLNDVGTGVGLAAGDPALVLREHMAARTRSGAKLHRGYAFGMLIKAWNARRGGRRIKVLRVGEGEDFPRVQ
jgi:hypothetical protein